MKITDAYLQVSELSNRRLLSILLDVDFNRLLSSLQMYFAEERTTLNQIQIVVRSNPNFAAQSGLNFDQFLFILGDNIVAMEPDSFHILTGFLQLSQTVC